MKNINSAAARRAMNQGIMARAAKDRFEDAEEAVFEAIGVTETIVSQNTVRDFMGGYKSTVIRARGNVMITRVEDVTFMGDKTIVTTEEHPTYIKITTERVDFMGARTTETETKVKSPYSQQETVIKTTERDTFGIKTTESTTRTADGQSTTTRSTSYESEPVEHRPLTSDEIKVAGKIGVAFAFGIVALTGLAMVLGSRK